MTGFVSIGNFGALLIAANTKAEAAGVLTGVVNLTDIMPPRGAWTSTATYRRGDLVSASGTGGGSFMCMVDNISGAATSPLIIGNQGTLWQVLGTSNDVAGAAVVTGLDNGAALMVNHTGATGGPLVLFAKDGAGRATIFSFTANVVGIGNNAGEQGFEVSATPGANAWVRSTSGTNGAFLNAVGPLNCDLVLGGSGTGSVKAGPDQIQIPPAGNAIKMRLCEAGTVHGQIGANSTTPMYVTNPAGTVLLSVFASGAVVSGVSIVTTTTTGGPTLQSIGAASDIPLNLGGKGAGTVNVVASLRLAQWTLATAPLVGNFNGNIIWISNGRKSGEGSGAGTGVAAEWRSTEWRVLNTTSAVTV
jgi:hypothetical protein